jgi:hypothetical protein
MVESHGVEMLLGMVLDPQFGPVVLIGAGGCTSRRSRRVHALPPFDADEAARLVDRLRIAPLLRSRRHRGRWRSRNSAGWQRASPRSRPPSATTSRRST